VTLTTPFLGVVCHRRLGFDTFYLFAKFDDYSFSLQSTYLPNLSLYLYSRYNVIYLLSTHYEDTKGDKNSENGVI